MDKRHTHRIELMKLLFAHTFLQNDEQHLDIEVASEDDVAWLEKISQALPAIDQQLSHFAPERPLSQINKVDLAIMRSIVFESQTQNTPKKVLIDEAVEMAKEFGTESSPKFVNGVLAKIVFADQTADTVESINGNR